MNSKSNVGKFIVSLDFELMWGVRDIVTMESYGRNILGVHTAIPQLLTYFKKYDIHATFAAVGFLFFETKEELLKSIPSKQPRYKIGKLSPYGDYMNNMVGADYKSDRYHFAPELISLIQNTTGQEIGTHTFSHYYCLEEWQTMDDFREDLRAAIDIAQKRGIQLTSIVFPRNQLNKNYLQVCSEAGLTCYRNNENAWAYNARSGEKESLLRRAYRLLDAYINLSGHHCYSENEMTAGYPMINIPSSRFLRPYSPKFRMLEWLRLRRIKKSMTYAAKQRLMFHLWWHPHNFGINQPENFKMLEKILLHYTYLNKTYSFTSVTMSELSDQLLNKEKKEKNEILAVVHSDLG